MHHRAGKSAGRGVICYKPATYTSKKFLAQNADDQSLTFYHVGGILRISLDNVPSGTTKIKVTLLGFTGKISGYSTVSSPESTTPSAAFPSDGTLQKYVYIINTSGYFIYLKVPPKLLRFRKFGGTFTQDWRYSIHRFGLFGGLSTRIAAESTETALLVDAHVWDRFLCSGGVLCGWPGADIELQRCHRTNHPGGAGPGRGGRKKQVDNYLTR